ncbi:hypothetical protein GCM10027176_56840 [Actinoallomurus bryophytorum]|uniref:Secreted protein n=1 Tax=Actinoallomurus bryophytorum TaxID=1490222 RepID=A0A543C0I8_9ACTN|nr:hypothetical protein [Actinoallomurus bryophytorum]TQL90589.1 hypothetical protein FB559_7897 [Actinoallomurus bryophytorum]
MTATLRVPRSRGALSGLLLVLLGLWGALVPIIGPYFHFGFTPDKAWDFTSGRMLLQIVPGCAVFLGGLVALASANRAFAAFGAWLAAVGGAWFAVGVPLSALWADQGDMRLGQAVGGTTRQVVEQITLLYGLGVVAVFLAAVALGRLAVVGVKDARLAEEASAAPVAGDDSELEPSPGPRPPLIRRRGGTKRDNVPPPRGPWPEEVPATPSDSTTPRTTNPSDVKVAGTPGAEETHSTDRPGANA